MAHIVVVGAGYGGMLAALRMGRQRQHQVTLVNATENFVERVRLHQAAAAGYQVEHSIRRITAGTHIDFVRARVNRIDPNTRAIHFDGEYAPLTYDRLIYALGSATATRTSGVREYAYTLSGAGEARRLGEAMNAKTSGRLIVVGGGLTGIESASELAERFPNWQITLVTSGQFGDDLSARGQAHLSAVFARMGIQVIENRRVMRVESSQVVTSDGNTIPFDVCLWAGAFSVSPLARESGLSVDAWDRVKIGEDLRSISHPSIYVVGDAAASGLRMACATAMPMGAHAADNVQADLDGDVIKPLRFGFAVRCISLGRRDGLIQVVDRFDQPQETIFTGRAAALFKESICLFAYHSLHVEKRLPGAYLWRRSDVPPMLKNLMPSPTL